MRWQVPLLLTLVLWAFPVRADLPKRVTLPNGLRLVLQSNWSTDVVAIEVLLDISAAEEPEGQQGIRQLVQSLLLRGTATESGEAAARRLALAGGVAQATLGLGWVELYALVPADGFAVALELLADALQHPAFLEEEVARQRAEAQALAISVRDDPFQETYLAFRQALYGSHPYSSFILGSPASLASISREDVIGFHRERYLPNRTVVAISGGVGEVRATRAVRNAFGLWQPGLPPPPRELPALELACSDVVARERPIEQVHVMLGFPAPAVGGPDYYPMQVIDAIIGGGATARLPRRLRDQLGLAYTVSSFYPTLASRSHLAAYVVTEPYALEAVKDAVLGCLGDLADQGVSAQELARAKAYLLGSYALNHQRMQEQAYAFAWYEILGLGADFGSHYQEGVSAVTAEEVQRAAARWFRSFVLAVTFPGQ